MRLLDLGGRLAAPRRAMPPKLGAGALKQKAANAKAAEKAKAKFEAEEKATQARAKAAAAKAAGGDAASAVLFQDQEELPPAFSRIFCIPRDAPRVLQIECTEGEKDPVVKYVGPDYGKSEGKYVTALPAISNDNFYCIPYASQRVLEINPKEGKVKGVGDRILRGCGKYTDAVASQDFRMKLYAAPCRARKVLQIDPVTGIVREVGKDLGDPNDAKEVVVRGMTEKSKMANGVYIKVDEKFDKFPYFMRNGPLPMDDESLANPTNANEAPEDSDDEFGDMTRPDFYIYCIKGKRWCLGTQLGAPWEQAWCWKRGKEEAPPGGPYTHVNVPTEELPQEERQRLEKRERKAAAEKEAAEKAAAEKQAAEEEARRAEQQRLLAEKYGKAAAKRKAKDINEAGARAPASAAAAALPAGEPPQDVGKKAEGDEVAQGEEESKDEEDEEENKEEESDEENFGPVKADATRCTGNPNFEVKHPPKWWACAYLPNKNRIYAVPYNARRVLRINPAKEGEAEEFGPDLGTLPGKYASIALAPNGCLFAAPLNAPRVLMINEEGQVSLVGPDFGKQERKYTCMILANNKLLYSPPYYADRVLEINCSKGDTRQIGPVLGMGEAKFCCGALHSNGNIYCPPLEARRVIEIRCADHEVEEFGMDLGGAEHEKFSCIASSVVGDKLYAAPREAHKVIEIDPGRYFIREVGPELGRIARKFTCVLAGPRVQPPRPEPEDEAAPLVKVPAQPEVPADAPAEAPPQEAPPPPQEPQQPQPLPGRAQGKQSSPERPQMESQANPWQRKPQIN